MPGYEAWNGRPRLAALLVLLLHGAALLLLLVPGRAVPPATPGALTVVDIPLPDDHAEGAAPPAPVLVRIPALLRPPAIEIGQPDRTPAPDAAMVPDIATDGGAASDGSLAGGGEGAAGTGTGEGAGPARRARRIAGDITRRDFPRAAAKDMPAASVTIRLTVGGDGRPKACAILRPSGDRARDAITCRLAMQRFRYQPALDGDGNPVEDVAGWRQQWWPEAGE